MFNPKKVGLWLFGVLLFTLLIFAFYRVLLPEIDNLAIKKGQEVKEQATDTEEGKEQAATEDGEDQSVDTEEGKEQTTTEGEKVQSADTEEGKEQATTEGGKDQAADTQEGKEQTTTEDEKVQSADTEEGKEQVADTGQVETQDDDLRYLVPDTASPYDILKPNSRDRKIRQIAFMFGEMEPAQAARLLEKMDESIAIEVLLKIPNRQAANILDNMRTNKASKFMASFLQKNIKAGTNKEIDN